MVTKTAKRVFVHACVLIVLSQGVPTFHKKIIQNFKVILTTAYRRNKMATVLELIGLSLSQSA